MKLSILPFVLAISFATISCDHSAGTDAKANDIIVSGTWRVSQFTDSGNNETPDFAGYTYTFTTAGTIMASKNGTNTSGTWSVNTGENKFNIDLGPKSNTNKPLGELTDDWKIISSTETELHLTDDNTASGEFVTFTKN